MAINKVLASWRGAALRKLVEVVENVDGTMDVLLDGTESGAGVALSKSTVFSTIAFYGDSGTELGASYLTPPTVASQTLGSTLSVKGHDLNCPAGAGTLTYSSVTKTLSWAANGESAGAAVDASKTGLIYVPSGVENHGLYLNWFGADRAYNSGTLLITAQAVGFNLVRYATNSHVATAMAFALQSLKLAYFAAPQNGNEAVYGLGGATSTEFLSASWQWGTIKSDIAVLSIGINDGPSSFTADKTISNIKAIVARINAARVVICTIPPRNADSAAQKAVKQQVNRWIYELSAISSRCIAFDDYSYLADPTTGDYVAASTSDNIHRNGKGGTISGKALGALLLSLAIASRPPIRQSFLGLFDATSNPYGSLLPTAGMGTFEGSGGTAGTGASGTIPTGWRVRRTTGAAMTAVGSKVAYADRPGSEWRVTLASSAANEVVSIDTGAGLSSNIAVGDVVEASVTVNVVSCTSLNTILLNIFDNGSGQQVSGFANGNGVLNDFTGPLVIRIPNWTIPVGFTNCTFQVQIGTASGGAAVIGFGDIEFKKVRAAP